MSVDATSASASLNFDNRVVFYRETFCGFDLEAKKKTFTYSPNFQVWLHDEAAVEVKRANRLHLLFTSLRTHLGDTTSVAKQPPLAAK